MSEYTAIKQTPVTKNSVSGNYFYTVSNFRRNVSWSKEDSFWVPVSNGLTLNSGVWTETGELSSLTLNGSLGDVVMMGERAKVRLLIDELKAHSGPAPLAVRGLELVRGAVRFAIHKDPAGFTVKTPSATISVKGTQFIVSYDEKNCSTDVKVIEGVVEVTNDAAKKPSQILNKGEVLSGIDTSGKEQKRPLQVKDTLEVCQFIDDTAQSETQTKNTESDIKHRIEKEQDCSSISLSSVKAEAAKAADSARTAAQKGIDSVRLKHEQAVDEENRKFDNYKTGQETKIDSTKRSAQKALDKERALFESKNSAAKDSINKKSDDAFDELHSRMKGQ